MSKVLLIAVNAKYIHSNPAVYSLGAYAREALEQLPGVEIEIAEYTINQNTETILADILQAQATGCGIFLLYLELEYGTGAASGAAEASAGYKALAGPTGGILPRGGNFKSISLSDGNYDRRRGRNLYGAGTVLSDRRRKTDGYPGAGSADRAYPGQRAGRYQHSALFI